MPEDINLRREHEYQRGNVEKKEQKRTSVRWDVVNNVRERFGKETKQLKNFLKDQEAEADIDPEVAKFVEAWVLTGVMPFAKEGGKFVDEMMDEVNAFLEILEEELPQPEEIHGNAGSSTSYRSSPGKEYFSDPRGRRVPPAPRSDFANGRPQGNYADKYTFGIWQNDDEVED